MNKKDLNNKISLIIPFYNAGRFSKDIARSIACQSVRPDQVIVIDDGNGRGIVPLKNAFNNNNIKFEIYSTSGNTGPGNARNLGLRYVKYRYVCFLDADDIWDENFLNSQMSLIQLNKCPAVSSSCYYFNHRGILNYLKLPNSISYFDFLHTNPVVISGVLLDLRKIKKIIFELKGHEDFRLWLKLAMECGDFFCNKLFLVGIRREKGSISSNKIRAAFWHWSALYELTNLNFFSRTILFFMYILNALTKRTKKFYMPIYLPDYILNLIGLKK